ncbi:cytochrome P450 [Mycena vulgaris]|nr:cytochrome P450 [Mycena vulgaris]
MYIFAATIFRVQAPFYLSATVFGIHVFSALGSALCYRLSPWHPLARFLGPFLWRISSLRLVQISLRGKRYIVLDDLHHKYGPFVRIGPSQLSVNLHSASNVIYGAATHMEKGDAYVTPGHPDAIALFFKQKTRTIHLERKRIWSPAFAPQNMGMLHCIKNRQSENKEQLLDLSEVFCHWAYDIMCEMVFGGSNNLELMKKGDPEGLIYGGKMATVILDCCRRNDEKRVEADAETTMRDLTSHLLDGRTSSGDAIPLEDLELEAVVAIQGGSDYTSTTLSLAFYYMLTSPHDYYQKLQQELDVTFPERDGLLDWDVLAGLPYLNAVINEALRLASPYYLPRIVPPGGVIIEGTNIPQGTSVALAAYSQQTSPDNFYPDPLSYRVERWLPGGLGPRSKTEKAALYSFSSGPHVCIAKSFAYQEMRYAIARLVLAYDLKLAPNFDAKKYRDGILNMRTTLLKEPLLIKAYLRENVNMAN